MYPNNIPEEPRRRATVECIDALRSLDGVRVTSHDDKSIVFDFGNFKYAMGYDWHDGQDCFFVDEYGEKFEEEQLIFVFLAGKKISEAEFSMHRGGERLIFWLPQVRAFFAGQLGEGKSKEVFRRMYEEPGFPTRENQDWRESFNRKLPDD